MSKNPRFVFRKPLRHRNPLRQPLFVFCSLGYATFKKPFIVCFLASLFQSLYGLSGLQQHNTNMVSLSKIHACFSQPLYQLSIHLSSTSVLPR